ncbi:MAG: hypothetical protein QG566_326 [Patescibacteria group bacterium]|nr:hypothetical protein [Patescibacteria group bacterium]
MGISTMTEEAWQLIIAQNNIDVSVYATAEREIVFHSESTQLLLWFARTVKDNLDIFVEIKNKNQFLIKENVNPIIKKFKIDLYPKPCYEVNDSYVPLEVKKIEVKKEEIKPTSTTKNFSTKKIKPKKIKKHVSKLKISPQKPRGKDATPRKKRQSGTLHENNQSKKFEEVKTFIKNQQKTWEEYFAERGFSVVVKEIWNESNTNIIMTVFIFNDLFEKRRFWNLHKLDYKFGDIPDKPKITINLTKPFVS